MQDILSHLKQFGTATPTKFMVEIPGDFPTPTDAFDSDFLKWKNNNTRNKHLQLLCETAQFPSLNITATDFTINGIPKHAPYGATTDNITLTFRLSGDMYEKMALEAWMMSIVDQKHSQIAYPKSVDPKTGIERGYKKNITIHQLKVVDPHAMDGVISVFGEETETSSDLVDHPATLTGTTFFVDNANIKSESIYHVTLFDAYPTSITALELGAGSQNEYHKLMVTFSFSYWQPFGQDVYTDFKPEPTNAILSMAPEEPIAEEEDKRLSRVKPAKPSKFRKLGELIEKVKKIMKFVKGLLGLEQGLVQELFNKLNDFLEGAIGLRIDDVRLFVEEFDRDVKSITAGIEGFSENGKASLLLGSAALLALLGNPPSVF